MTIDARHPLPGKRPLVVGAARSGLAAARLLARHGLDVRLADGKLAGIAAEDIGKCAYGVFRKGAETIGRTIGIAGEHLTGAQMAAAMSKALGREVVGEGGAERVGIEGVGGHTAVSVERAAVPM